MKKMIEVEEDTELLLERIRKEHGFKTMGEVVDFLADDYKELKPEYVKKLERIRKEKLYSQEEFDKLMSEE